MSKTDENNESLSDQLDQLNRERNPCEWLLERPKLVDRFFADPQMNDPRNILVFLRFLTRTMPISRVNMAKLVIRLPGSSLLSFAYEYLKSLLRIKDQENVLHDLGKFLAQLLKFLLELHPSCYAQLDSLGIFDRLEMVASKNPNPEMNQKIVTLTELVDELREQRDRVVTKHQQKQAQFERDDPPPDDFHQLSIYPTLGEIFQHQMPYLRKNITEGQYKDGSHYLDIHFRLLREDFLCPLREAMCQYMSQDDKNVSYRNVNVRLYKNAILTGFQCSHAGLLFTIGIDLFTLPKSISWSNSRRLIYGNLLAATFDDFQTSCFLLSVEDRSNIDKDGTIHVRCQKELCDSKLMRIPPGTRFTLLETTSYFEAYRPILQALQNITGDRLPLERYLLNCDTNVNLPAYFEENDQIDFRPILTQCTNVSDAFDGTLSHVHDPSTWPDARQLGLDESQHKALELALTKAVALIQGPPGCGKTFLGVRLAELFYHNRTRITGCKHPILMICYTNHALDQFLSSIIQKLALQPGEVVRVGGRSKHPEIEPFLIQKLRQRRDNVRANNEELSMKYEILHNVKKQIDDCYNDFYTSCDRILSVEQLLRVMDKEQFLTFIEPILNELEIYKNHWLLRQNKLFCCDHKSPFDETSSDSDSSDDDDDEIVDGHSDEKRKNRINCVKLNQLSDDDKQTINKLILKWLNTSQMQVFADQSLESNEDNDWQEVKRNKKYKDKATALLKEIMADSTSAAAATNTTTGDDEPLIVLEEDEEETRRMENIDNPMVPLSFPNQTNRKGQQQTEATSRQLENMQRLLNRKTAMLSDDEVKRIDDLWSTSKQQRLALYRYWLSKYAQMLTEEWFRLNEQYAETFESMQELWLVNDSRHMTNAFIIAMTTHCASRYQKVLKKIAPRICIVEEAAEVFESHIVTAVGEHVEHLILIGDHIQLRPSPNVYTLAKHFNLDVSLFERLIKNRMPAVQLRVQHRSIPIIASLVRHFYDIPIINHQSVLDRAPINGILHPLYFIDHQNLEETVADGASKRNTFESNYILHLASYLIHQGYGKNEITLLTTYMGQRQLIQHTINNQFQHLKGIHVTVVDNFQGEENRIVILSLVRSNLDKHLGYVAVQNRICVALSRAQNGFYVIGNFKLLAELSETWKVIVNQMNDLKLCGPGLPIHCPNHQINKLVCTQARDFLRRPLGGCGLKCDSRLSCGHTCPLTCHIPTMHSTLVCVKPCLKTYADCEHQCEKKCHSTEPCPPCVEMISFKMPHCQHTSNLPCFMKKTNQLDCGVLLPYTCQLGHEVQVRCCDLRNDDLRDRLCNHPCGATLECGHTCVGNCATCLKGQFHRPCNEEELIVYICGHSRKQRCHELGPRCDQAFIKICAHDDEPKVLSTATECSIYECNRYCLNRCKHGRCSLRCKTACERLPCYEKCSRRLECEHYCNGVCGEPCIDCFRCRILSPEIRQTIARQNMRYATFVQLECQHLIKTEELDEHVEKWKNKIFLANGYMIIDYPRCSRCQWPLINCKRYSSLIKQIHTRINGISGRVRCLTKISDNLIDVMDVDFTSSDTLPAQINAIVTRTNRNSRHRGLVKLFLFTINLFRKLNDRVDHERNRILTALYSHIETNNSLFLTRQQWSDLENEYNRLALIDLFKALPSTTIFLLDKMIIETLNDILFGPNPYTQVTDEICKSFLSRNNENWQALLPDGHQWKDYEQDRLMCDNRWNVCPKGQHMLWRESLSESTTCDLCASENDSLRSKTMTYRYGRGRVLR